MQKVFKLTNNYIVLTTPLILYSLLSNIYFAVSVNAGRIINILFAMALMFFMTGAFIAGWFNMIKMAVLNPEPEDGNSLIKEFVPGVGEYFLSSIGLLIVMSIASLIVFLCFYAVGHHYIGDLGIPARALLDSLNSQESLVAFFKGLSEEQLLKLHFWNFVVFSATLLCYFLTFLYIPALFLKTKNPLKAYGESLKAVFSKHIFQTLGVFLLIMGLNLILTFLTSITLNNSFVNFIMTLIGFYFVTVVSVGIFYYYNEKFVKPLVGQNVDLEI